MFSMFLERFSPGEFKIIQINKILRKRHILLLLNLSDGLESLSFRVGETFENR
jgi:hypothetical protein